MRRLITVLNVGPQVVKKRLCVGILGMDVGRILDLQESAVCARIVDMLAKLFDLGKGKYYICEFAEYNNFIVWILKGKEKKRGS